MGDPGAGWSSAFAEGAVLNCSDGVHLDVKEVHNSALEESAPVPQRNGLSLSQHLTAMQEADEQRREADSKAQPPKALDWAEADFLAALDNDKREREEQKRKDRQTALDEFHSAVKSRMVIRSDGVRLEDLMGVSEEHHETVHHSASPKRTHSSLSVLSSLDGGMDAITAEQSNKSTEMFSDVELALKKKKRKKTKKKKKDGCSSSSSSSSNTSSFSSSKKDKVSGKKRKRKEEVPSDTTLTSKSSESTNKKRKIVAK